MSSDLPEGGEFLSFYGMADYQAAIAAAPPGTLIKLGDLEKNLVTCTTCNEKMSRKASEFHKHPKKCEACGVHYDENMVKHTPIHQTRHVGAGSVTFTAGCKEEAL